MYNYKNSRVLSIVGLPKRSVLQDFLLVSFIRIKAVYKVEYHYIKLVRRVILLIGVKCYVFSKLSNWG